MPRPNPSAEALQALQEMRAAGLSLREIARRTGLSPGTVNAVLKGRRNISVPRWEGAAGVFAPDQLRVLRGALRAATAPDVAPEVRQQGLAQLRRASRQLGVRRLLDMFRDLYGSTRLRAVIAGVERPVEVVALDGRSAAIIVAHGSEVKAWVRGLRVSGGELDRLAGYVVRVRVVDPAAIRALQQAGYRVRPDGTAIVRLATGSDLQELVRARRLRPADLRRLGREDTDGTAALQRGGRGAVA